MRSQRRCFCAAGEALPLPAADIEKYLRRAVSRWGAVDRCWLHKRALHPSGVPPGLQIACHWDYVHRWCWRLLKGPIQKRIARQCDTPRCCNPAHWAERGKPRKLSDADVGSIVVALRAGQTRAALAKQYRVSYEQIRLLSHGYRTNPAFQLRPTHAP